MAFFVVRGRHTRGSVSCRQNPPRVWFNGRLIDASAATVNFLTPALHYGIGVFEGIRCYTTDDGPAIFRLKEHTTACCARRGFSASVTCPTMPTPSTTATVETVRDSGLGDCYIRPLIYPGRRRLEPRHRRRHAARGHRGLGVERVPGRRGPAARRARQRLVVHAAPPERADDEGQGLRATTRTRSWPRPSRDASDSTKRSCSTRRVTWPSAPARTSSSSRTAPCSRRRRRRHPRRHHARDAHHPCRRPRISRDRRPRDP